MIIFHPFKIYCKCGYHCPHVVKNSIRANSIIPCCSGHSAKLELDENAIDLSGERYKIEIVWIIWIEFFECIVQRRAKIFTLLIYMDL